jgi:hypothetical protein
MIAGCEVVSSSRSAIGPSTCAVRPLWGSLPHRYLRIAGEFSENSIKKLLIRQVAGLSESRLKSVSHSESPCGHRTGHPGLRPMVAANLGSATGTCRRAESF